MEGSLPQWCDFTDSMRFCDYTRGVKWTDCVEFGWVKMGQVNKLAGYWPVQMLLELKCVGMQSLGTCW